MTMPWDADDIGGSGGGDASGAAVSLSSGRGRGLPQELGNADAQLQGGGRRAAAAFSKAEWQG